MFAKKHASMFGAFVINSKASRGRHARVKGCGQSARCAFESSAGRAQAFAVNVPHGPRAAQSRSRQGKFRPLRVSASRGLSLSTRASF